MTMTYDTREWNDKNFEYVKDILLAISRIRQSCHALEQLKHACCWPCRTPSGRQRLCAIGNFYVNDRQDLFDIFVDHKNFLYFDFNKSKVVKTLLEGRGCVSFLSKQATLNTTACEPLEFDSDLTQNYRSRANALNRYVIQIPCRSFPHTIIDILITLSAAQSIRLAHCWQVSRSGRVQTSGQITHFKILS